MFIRSHDDSLGTAYHFSRQHFNIDETYLKKKILFRRKTTTTHIFSTVFCTCSQKPFTFCVFAAKLVTEMVNCELYISLRPFSSRRELLYTRHPFIMYYYNFCRTLVVVSRVLVLPVGSRFLVYYFFILLQLQTKNYYHIVT